MHMKYPGVEEIIKIFNNLMFFPDKNFNLPTSDIVAVDYAVLYHIEGESQDRFLIIEQSPYAKKIDFEYSPTDDFVEDIMGKKVGDKFIIGDIIQKRCIIKEIKHKILFKFHRYLEEGKGMPDGFRGAINTPMRPDGSLDLQELKEYLNNVDEQHSTLSTAAQHVYLEKLPSIYVFSSFSNLSLAQTIIFLCRQDKMCINAAIGVDSERKESSKFFKEAESIILSPLTLELLVAFSAIMNIDAVEILRNSSKRFTVSEYTVSDFIAQEDYYSTEGIQLINNESRIITNKYLYNTHENYCNLVDFLEDASLVTVVPGSLNKSNFSKANLNIKGALGRALFHTLMLATQNPSMLLWEDDANTIKLCNNSFPQEINAQKRIFTQGVFFQLVNDKIVDDKIADKACIFLILLNVDFTRITSTALFEIFTNAEYKDLIPRVMKSIEDSEINSTIKVTSIAIAMLLKRSTNIRRTIDHSIIPLCDQCLSRDTSMLKKLLSDVFILLRSDRQAVKNMKRVIKRQYSALFRPYELSNLGRDIE